VLLYLVRHGETEWNRLRRIQGISDIPLNDVGREQAKRTGALLAGRSWDAVFSSPLERAHETASIIADELGLPAPTVDVRLTERDYGQAEGMDFVQMQEHYPNDAEIPGRERRSVVATRAIAALDDIAAAHPDSSVVIVTHGGLIRSVLGRVDPQGEHGLITNGSVHSFRHDDGAVSLIAFDDPIEKETAEGDDVLQQNAAERG
jgi:probable phosphoglycerate mutase